MQELLTNIHIHTTYSDGSKTHAEIIKDAVNTGIDVLFFSDHNIYVKGIEGYYNISGKQIMVIMGEEIHDPNANPQKNHLLALGTTRELSAFSDNRTTLIAKVQANGGGAFIAHPYDPALPDFNEPNISWEDWSVNNFDGIELWNGFSELKVRSKKKISAYLFALFPQFLPFHPPLKTMRIWDEMHRSGKKASAIAGSDAHAITFTAGPLKRVLFPYTYHFSTINNHLLLSEDLTGDFKKDRKRVVGTLVNGRNYIANDMIKPATGFRFFIENKESRGEMGETIRFSSDQIANFFIPDSAKTSIFRDGKTINQLNGKGHFEYPLQTKGVYRIECQKFFRGRKRGWIYSNPIYVV